jgi:hypothetical protein
MAEGSSVMNHVTGVVVLGLNDIFNVASDRQVGVLPKLYEAVLFYIEWGTCDFYLRCPL